jgi:predicted DNA-binding transcriptional regulator YafY
MNRIDRLSAILIMLQTKKLVKAAEIAERFEISLRTVYRDMRALNEAGVPIGAEAGIGYYLIEGYHLPPVMFTPEEAGSLLIAQKLINCFSDKSVKHNFDLAADKIKSVLPDSHQQFLGQVDNHIHVFHKPIEETQDFSNNYITKIQQAISEGKCIELNYFSKYNEVSTCRIVEPVGLCFYGFNWHLIAYCKLRNDYRDFRLDRIESYKTNLSNVSAKTRIRISDYFNRIWNDESLFNVSITFNRNVLPKIVGTRYYFGFYEEIDQGENMIMKFAVNDFSYIGSWLMSLETMVIKIEPEALRKYIVNTIQNLSKQYL